MGRDTFYQTRLLKAPSSLALNTARDGATTVSLGNLGQGLTNLIVKNVFLTCSLNLPSFGLELLPLVLSHGRGAAHRASQQGLGSDASSH